MSAPEKREIWFTGPLILISLTDRESLRIVHWKGYIVLMVEIAAMLALFLVGPIWLWAPVALIAIWLGFRHTKVERGVDFKF